MPSMNRDRAKRIDERLAVGDITQAATWAQQAIDEGEQDVMYLNLAAWRCEEAGDFAGARRRLEQALRLAPGDPSITTAIGTALRKEGRLAEAVAAIDATLARHPDHIVSWLERGFALEAAGSFHAAAQSFETVVLLDPTLAAAHAGLAWIAAIEGDRQRVLDQAARAHAIEPNNVTASYAIARSEIEQGLLEAARDRLDALLERSDIEPAQRMVALGLSGDALDRLDATETAYARYQAANRLFDRGRPRPDPNGEAPPTHSDFVRAIRAAVETTHARWQATSDAAAPGPARRHVFVLGYPRSGTTLVENILASAAGVEALEESATLIDAEQRFLLDPRELATLFALDTPALDEWRTRYWDRVRAAGIDPTDRLFVDMDPLKSIKLPLIAKLFADARIVVVRRDPRDVVWSCFRTSFARTLAAFDHVTLERAARHYDAVMQLTQTCLDRLPITAHVVRHEQVVRDFDATTQALCAFVDMPWTPDLRRFDRTAQRRGVATASASQVRKGLFDSNDRWRRYADQFDTVAPILQPWVERFGYRS